MSDLQAGEPLTHSGGTSSPGMSPSLAFLHELARAPALMPSVRATPWHSERFTLRERLGEGGFGTVYEALDGKRGAAVALKLLRRVDAHALLLFKQEFRALAGLTHPNLVQLYELFSEGDAWFFTMERLRGQRFTRCVPPPRERGEGRDMEHLRRLLRQLADGVAFLHDAGKLHRDIKPSNVMVTDEDRVVLLDFGLVTDLSGTPREELAAGTPRYMAPEQSAARPIGPAADWYSVGVMLYEVLTGHLPVEVPEDADGLPVSPRLLAPDVPEDLEALCVALLARAPEQRPTGARVRAWLAGPVSRRFLPPLEVAPSRAGTFIGREPELRQLRRALSVARTGKAVVALVHGPSGIGKSALVQRFLDDLQAEPGAGAAMGRCFEQESVPYKLLDSLMDALCRTLRALPGAPLSPADLGALARLFPVFRQLPACPEVSWTDAPVQPQEQRRRAVAAVRALLQELAARGTRVLWLDDIQWGDLEGADFLLEVLQPPEAPPVLVVATYRGDESESSPVLASLLPALRAASGAGLEVHEVAVGALGQEEAERLASTLLDASEPHAALAFALGTEGQGHPFFITELAQLAREGHAASELDSCLRAPVERLGSEGAVLMGHAASEQGSCLRARVERLGREGAALSVQGSSALDALLLARVERLPSEARRLLEVVALASQPLSRSCAVRAAFDTARECELPALTRLRAGHLVRVRWRDGAEELLPYHDRIREAVAAGLPPEVRRERHLGLAQALEASGHARAEQLLLHFREGGRRDIASSYAVEAASHAHSVLAFDRAATLYREALALGGLAPEAVRPLTARLGEALAAAGRPAEAARAWLDAAEGEEASQALAWRHRAMDQLLLGGYTREGREVLRQLQGDVGLRAASSVPGALLGAWMRGWGMRARGMDLQPPAAREVPEAERLRLDVCWSAALGLSLADPIPAADFRVRHLDLALRSGDAYRASRGLALHAVFQGMRGGRASLASTCLLRRASALAEQSGHPHARGWVALGQGMVALYQGNWREAEPLLRGAAESMLQAQGASWELDFARMQRAFCLWQMGEVPELARTVPMVLDEVRARGHRYFDALMRATTGCMVALAGDAPEEAEALVRSMVELRQHQGYTPQQVRAEASRLRIALYRGEGAQAWALVRQQRFLLMRAGLLRVRLLRVELRYLHALAALATPTLKPSHAERLALRSARVLAGEGIAWAEAMAGLLRAAVASRRGRREDALQWLGDAEGLAAGQGMVLLANCIHRRRGELLGGAAGAALLDAADRELTGRGIRAPARMASMLTPPLHRT
ncbi:serine/threonine-protein kinase PknK [Myxococcus sp. Y35]|uniref:serine/threonine-protein kinase n=1 Tax=Pseudomyxococcus flavus TaxID=3115648 RepID=UPI003CEC7467